MSEGERYGADRGTRRLTDITSTLDKDALGRKKLANTFVPTYNTC